MATEFKRGMIVAVNVIDSDTHDTPSIMVIDTARLDPEDAGQAQWLKAIAQNFDAGDRDHSGGITGDEVYPDYWDVLEVAEITRFPVSIDGKANCYFGGD